MAVAGGKKLRGTTVTRRVVHLQKLASRYDEFAWRAVV